MKQWIGVSIFLIGAGCYRSGFNPWGEDATVVIEWKINNHRADDSICGEVGAKIVRMSINSSREPWYDPRLEWECGAGGWNSIDQIFAEGEFWVQFELLDSNRALITNTQWERKKMVAGINQLEVNFNVENK